MDQLERASGGDADVIALRLPWRLQLVRRAPEAYSDATNEAHRVVESDIEGLWLEKPSLEAPVDAIHDTAAELISHNHGAQATPPVLRIFREVGAPTPISLGA